jgi:hypothetical protein
MSHFTVPKATDIPLYQQHTFQWSPGFELFGGKKYRWILGDGGGTVVLRCKSEGRWFDSRWCHWNFSLT